MHMGMTAENVCTNETYQKKYGYSPISREQLDEMCIRDSNGIMPQMQQEQDAAGQQDKEEKEFGWLSPTRCV